MADLSYFESRTGTLTCSAEDAFSFVTDMRNFGRFIPDGRITGWKAGKESCSFNVSLIGTVNVALTDKLKFTKVVYTGDALKRNDFTLTLRITDHETEPAVVNILLCADLNPVMKMMAARPIDQFLEMLITEMERFTGWKEFKE